MMLTPNVGDPVIVTGAYTPKRRWRKKEGGGRLGYTVWEEKPAKLKGVYLGTRWLSEKDIGSRREKHCVGDAEPIEAAYVCFDTRDVPGYAPIKNVWVPREINAPNIPLIEEVVDLRCIPAASAIHPIAVIAGLKMQYDDFVNRMYLPYRKNFQYCGVDLRWPNLNNFMGLNKGLKFSGIVKLHRTRAVPYRRLEKEILENHMAPWAFNLTEQKK